MLVLIVDSGVVGGGTLWSERFANSILRSMVSLLLLCPNKTLT